MEKIKVIVKRPDEPYGHVTNISNTLKNFQKIVEGPIETVPVFDGCLLVCNEEGKIRDLERNFYLGVFPFGDMIVGTCIICGVDGEEFGDIPIDMETWKVLLSRYGEIK